MVSCHLSSPLLMKTHHIMYCSTIILKRHVFFSAVLSVFALCFFLTAIRAKVLSESVDNSTRSRSYKVRIMKTFKGKTEIKSRNGTEIGGEGKRRKKLVRVHTDLDSAACGIQLETSKIYLLLGYIRERKLRVDSCQWHQLWKDTTGQQHRGLKRFYSRNCACRIEKYCFRPAPETCDDMIGGCDVPDKDWRVTVCKRKYALCLKSKRGDACHWALMKKPAFRKCLSKN